MTALGWIKIIVAVATMGFGLMSIISPTAAERFTGLTADSPRGTSEIRAVLGGSVRRPRRRRAHLPHRRRVRNPRDRVLEHRRRPGRLDLLRSGRYPPTNWLSLAFEIVFGIVLLV